MSEKLRRKLTKLIHDGSYAAEVEVEIVYDEIGYEQCLRTMRANSKQCELRFAVATSPKRQSTATCSE